MRRLRATAAAFVIAAALSTGRAQAEAPDEDAKPVPATVQPATSLPEAAGVVAGAVLLQAALVGMALLILFPRRRGAAVSSATPVPRR